jgi:hypothetical protein
MNINDQVCVFNKVLIETWLEIQTQVCDEVKYQVRDKVKDLIYTVNWDIVDDD